MSASGYKLYTFFRSSTAWRARIALNLKQIKPQYIFVHLFKGQQRSQQYKKINPNTGVPSLVLPDGTVLIQSMAIIQYLNQIKPQPYNLFPGDAKNRAQIRGFCQVINSGIHPYQNLKLIEQLHKEHKVDKVQWCKQWTGRGVQTIESLIVKNGNSGKYVFGDKITAGDVFFYPQVMATKMRWGVDLSPYPNVTRILENLQKVQQFKDAQPENQPDREEK